MKFKKKIKIFLTLPNAVRRLLENNKCSVNVFSLYPQKWTSFFHVTFKIKQWLLAQSKLHSSCLNLPRGFGIHVLLMLFSPIFIFGDFHIHFFCGEGKREPLQMTLLNCLHFTYALRSERNTAFNTQKHLRALQ